MPTPRMHGGAALTPINLTSPGFFGLNTSASGSILGVEWAAKLNNAIFDDQGRPALRKGWLTGTSSAVSGVPMRIFEYFKADGTSQIIFSTDSDIFQGVGSPTSIDGTLTITDGNIKFVNFNDDAVAFGIGTSGYPAAYSGTGNFADGSFTGTPPNGKIGTAAFGRLWGVDNDGKTIRYSALLDWQDWSSASGGGIIDMSKAWVAGQDKVVAIEEMGGDLVIFGQNQVVIWTDGSGSDIGISPDNLYISDTLPGVGAVSQFAITKTNSDLWALSPNGIISLRRELTERTTPFTNVSQNVQNEILDALDVETNEDDLTLMYSPRQNFVLCVFPESEKVVHFDAETPLQDGSWRATTWSTTLQTAAYIRDDRTVRGSLSGVEGEVFTYSGYEDNGDKYSFEYETGWLDLGEQAAQYLKFVKRMSSVVFVETDTAINHTVKFDFDTSADSFQVTASGGLQAQFNVSEYGANGSIDPNNSNLTPGTDVAEFSGNIALRTLRVPGRGSGQYIRLGVTVQDIGAQFALQQLNLFAKVGRIAG